MYKIMQKIATARKGDATPKRDAYAKMQCENAKMQCENAKTRLFANYRSSSFT
jgi:hypothetical protein